MRLHSLLDALLRSLQGPPQDMTRNHPLIDQVVDVHVKETGDVLRGKLFWASWHRYKVATATRAYTFYRTEVTLRPAPDQPGP